MDRREFLKKSTLGVGALAATSLLAHPTVAEIKKLITDKQKEDMLTSSLIKVNPDKCIHCGACIKDCMQSCLEFDEQQLPRLKAQGLGCGECQHCMAVCPTAALSWGGIDPEKLEAVCLADSEQLLGLMKSRRSTRQFKKTDVPEEKLQQLSTMLSYPPRGGNCYILRFSLIGSRERMQAVKQTTYDNISGGSGFVNMLVESHRHGKDLIYWDAPAMLVTFVSRTNVVRGCETVDPIIAMTYAELYANSLGLGTVWCHIATNMVRAIPALQRLVDMPAGYDIAYAMLLGVPAVKYRRVVKKELDCVKILK